jgi:phosphonate metabolism protein (transferase hexapeptide repeat family)
MQQAESEIQKESRPKRKQLSAQPFIHPGAKVIGSRLGAYTEVGARTVIQETLMGDYSYITNDGNVIYSRIGKFCSIAAMARINPGNHPMQRATQHHFTYRSRQFNMGDDDPEIFNWRRSQPVTIGHDVWVGHGATILAGTQIGTGAVVGAGAVVTKDVAPYTIVAGVPAAPIRLRFPEAVQEALGRICWWNWSHEQLTEAMPDFRGLRIEQFIQKYDVTAQQTVQSTRNDQQIPQLTEAMHHRLD